MYDPEFNLLIERQLSEMQSSIEKSADNLGHNHPFISICEGIQDLFEMVEESRNDYENCFDEERENKAQEIRSVLNDIELLWHQVDEFIKEKIDNA